MYMYMYVHVHVHMQHVHVYMQMSARNSIHIISPVQSYYLRRRDAGAILAPSWSASPRAPLQPPMARRTAHSTY